MENFKFQDQEYKELNKEESVLIEPENLDVNVINGEQGKLIEEIRNDDLFRENKMKKLLLPEKILNLVVKSEKFKEKRDELEVTLREYKENEDDIGGMLVYDLEQQLSILNQEIGKINKEINTVLSSDEDIREKYNTYMLSKIDKENMSNPGNLN